MLGALSVYILIALRYHRGFCCVVVEVKEEEEGALENEMINCWSTIALARECLVSK